MVSAYDVRNELLSAFVSTSVMKTVGEHAAWNPIDFGKLSIAKVENAELHGHELHLTYDMYRLRWC
jgi:hypothetical protein